MTKPPDPPLRVAVVGAGPSGFYTAAHIMKVSPGACVNMFERLPTPWGLLRAGVAPDHENMRAVGGFFDRIAEDPGFRLLANVEVGRDVSHTELLAHHHAVAYATGTLRGRLPHDVAGADLPHSLTAERVVGWYNGHPDYSGSAPHLGTERAVVVGNGNVALDVARMLARPPEDLRETDISDLALRSLETSAVREVVILGRRGPTECGFTLPELLELEKVRGIGVDVCLGGSSLTPSKDATPTHRGKLETLARLAERADSHIDRRIVLRFMSRPTAIVGDVSVESVTVERTMLDADGQAIGTGLRADLSAGLVVWAVGFRGTPIPGVPYDGATGTIPNLNGRVVDPATGSVLRRTYVAGWVKRGPVGVIGENKRCGTETAASIVSDHVAGHLQLDLPPLEELHDLLLSRDVAVVDADGWRRVNAAERERGLVESRPRVKFVSRNELLAVAGS